MNSSLPPLAPVELELMTIVWRLGSCSPRDVLNEASLTRQVAYTTIQTQLKILTRKGFLEVTRMGKTDFYRPRISRKDIQTSALRHLIDTLFDQSDHALAQHLVQRGAISAADIEELKELIDSKSDEEI